MPNTSNALESTLQRVHRTSAQPAGSAETRMESSAHTVRLRQSGAMPVKPRSRQCRISLNTSPITHGSLPVLSGIKTSVVAARMPPAAVAARNFRLQTKTNMIAHFDPQAFQDDSIRSKSYPLEPFSNDFIPEPDCRNPIFNEDLSQVRFSKCLSCRQWHNV